MAERKAAVLISLALIPFIQGFLEIIPERAGVEYINEKYVQNATLYVRRISRGGVYVANLDFVTNNTLANNVTMHLISYQFLHNEYRRSFIEAHLKLCNLIEKGVLIGVALRNIGVHCPIAPNEYHFHNLTLAVPEIQNMKWVFPFEKAKFQATFQLTTTNETFAIGYMMLFIRQSQKKTRVKS